MANNIGWGQGAINNSIGWGQGAINNNISWGASQSVSESGETNIVGLSISSMVANFQARVIADSGTFEGSDCMVTLLNSI